MKQISNGAAPAAWLTKPEALRALQISERSLDRLVTAGKVQKQTRPRPGRTPEPIFHAGDIERLATRAAHTMPEVSPGGQPLASSPAAPPLALAAFTAILQQLAATPGALRALPPADPQSASAPAPAWLDLEQASRASGLSARLLRSLIRSRQLAALKDGRAWKIHREDLAAVRAQPAAAPKPKVKGAHE